MQPRTFRHRLRMHTDNDAAISPVIGTILMIAATVIIGGAVYAAVNAYSGRASKSSVDAAFRAQAVDTDEDGKSDMIKITYLSGPEGTEVRAAADGNATNLNQASSPGAVWSPGDFATWGTNGDTADAVYVTASIGSQTFLDQTLRLDE